MPSKKRRRKPARRLKPEAVLWALLVVNVALGAAFSPLTAVRKLRVVGAAVSDQKRIEKEAQYLRDVPVLRLNATWVEYRLADSPETETLTFSPNMFGRAVVNVTLKSAVARIAGSHMFLDPHGEMYWSSLEHEGLPVVYPPKSAFAPSMTLTGGWECGPTAQLCENLAAQVPNLVRKVELTDRGVISLEVDSGAEVVLGSSENLPRKIEKLKSLLDEKPGLFKSVRQLNLTSPEAPMVVRG